ncbi:MAG: hypothetical protein WCJ30_08835 [Deltaproteobacteria bacterium]
MFVLFTASLSRVACVSARDVGVETALRDAEIPEVDTPRAALQVAPRDATRRSPRTDSPRGIAGLGARCSARAPCLEGYLCDDDDAGGFCTRACVPFGDGTLEAAACRDPRGTCVAFGVDDRAPGWCALACDPTRAGTCGPGRACTMSAWAGPRHDSPGCFPFCRGDADCAPGARCNTRTGACGARGVDLSLAADGAPCDPRDGEPPCRGVCLGIDDTDPDLGVCASLVDSTVAHRCPDDPAHIVPRAFAGDAIAVCAFEACELDPRCPGGRACVHHSSGDGCE